MAGLMLKLGSVISTLVIIIIMCFMIIDMITHIHTGFHKKLTRVCRVLSTPGLRELSTFLLDSLGVEFNS